jgi:phosphoglycolate phosphatase-like HAD superfamily hydrolase
MNNSYPMIIVFDIDGTLTSTSSVDESCYLNAFEDVFGFEIQNTDWSSYRYFTDSGIAWEVVNQKLKRDPSSLELEWLEERLVVRLREALEINPREFSEVPGARQLIIELLQADKYQIAFASGGFRKSAHLKLEQIGIDAREFPGAFANDGISRKEIIQKAIQRAIPENSGLLGKTIIYVGDGIWDIKAAWQLGIKFIGISCDAPGEILRRAGAQTILKDLSDCELFFDAVRESRIPLRSLRNSLAPLQQ